MSNKSISDENIEKMFSKVKVLIDKRDYHSANTELDKLQKEMKELSMCNRFLVKSSETHRLANEKVNEKEAQVNKAIIDAIQGIKTLIAFIQAE